MIKLTTIAKFSSKLCCTYITEECRICYMQALIINIFLQNTDFYD